MVPLDIAGGVEVGRSAEEFDPAELLVRERLVYGLGLASDLFAALADVLGEPRAPAVGRGPLDPPEAVLDGAQNRTEKAGGVGRGDGHVRAVLDVAPVGDVV